MTSETTQRDPGRRSALMELIALAAPSAATMLSYPIMQLVDAWMVSRLGDAAVAAQGNGGLIVWVLISTVVGALSVINTYVSQNLGAGRPERTSAYAWNGLWICAGAALVMLPLIPLMGPLFALDFLEHTPELQRMETDYAQITLAGAFFMMAARSIHQFFYGVHRPGVVFATALVAHALNVVLNYALIFGEFGAPALGVAGAALGTVAASAVEFGLPFALFLSKRCHERYASRTSWRFSTLRVRELVRLGWPAGAQSGNEIFCWGAFMIVFVSGFGPAHGDAGWIALRFMMLSFMPALGISFAITAVVGRAIGAGDHDAAAHRAALGVALSVGYMAFWGVAMVVFREPLVRSFISDQHDPETAARILEIGKQVMIVAALFQIFDALGIAMMGALRGAGDTVWPGLTSAGLAWLIILGGGFAVTTLAPHWGSLGPWVAAAAYIVALGVALLTRWWSGRWRAIEVVGRAPTGPAASPEAA